MGVLNGDDDRHGNDPTAQSVTRAVRFGLGRRRLSDQQMDWWYVHPELNGINWLI